MYILLSAAQVLLSGQVLERKGKKKINKNLILRSVVFMLKP
jgi:hypothetical protein